MKCPTCNVDVLEDSLFCHRCGAKLGISIIAAAEVEEGGIDFSKRILCSDGSCIGVVNDQGICKVCGKPYTEAPGYG